MAFGNDGTINVTQQDELKEKRKQAMFSSSSEISGNIVFPKNVIVDVPMDLIDENPDNDKIFNMNHIDRLAEHIKEDGYDRACPITLFEKPDGRYEINAGHRRYRANKIAGNNTIPSVIKEDVSSAEKAKRQLDANLYNRVLTYYDYAQAINYYRNNYLIPSGYKGNVRKAVCKYFGFTDTTLQRYMDFMKVIPELQEFSKQESFPSSALGEAASLSVELQLELADNIEQLRPKSENERWMTARQLGEMIESIKRREEHKKKLEKQRQLIDQANENAYTYDMNTRAPAQDAMITISLEESMDDDFGTVINMPSEIKDASANVEVNQKIAESQDSAFAEKKNEKTHERKEVVLPKPKVVEKKVKSKPDISTVVSLIKNEISSIVVEEYDVKDKERTTKLVSATIEELQELLAKIMNI